MKRNLLKNIFLSLCLVVFPMGMAAKQEATVTSPSGNLTLTAGVDKAGRPYYSLSRGKEAILLPSYLGVKLKDGSLNSDFGVMGFVRATKDETWHQPWGEENDVRNHYNELTMKLAQRKGLKRQLTIVFRVFDDGMGFRYVFPEQKNLKHFVIMDEETEFCFKGDPEAWTLPYDADYYEGLWTKAPLSKKQKVCTPITIEAKPDLYMMLHEANLTDYASLNVKPVETKEGNVRMRAELVPWSNGDLVRAKAPFVSPWRMLSVENNAGGLITNRVMLNLNDPCKIKDTSWITTGKYVGVWWAYHMQHATWAIGPKHGATTENTKRYIDFAAQHGFKGVLVEGWNYGWEHDWGKEGDKFNFTKAYPDYDFDGLQKYALSKGVSLIAHNETGGAAKNYENQLEAAFTLYEKMGIKAIKTGYVNKVMDNKELQHSQYGVRHYRKSLRLLPDTTSWLSIMSLLCLLVCSVLILILSQVRVSVDKSGMRGMAMVAILLTIFVYFLSHVSWQDQSTLHQESSNLKVRFFHRLILIPHLLSSLLSMLSSILHGRWQLMRLRIITVSQPLRSLKQCLLTGSAL